MKGIVFSFIIFFLAVTVIALLLLQRSLISSRLEEIFVEERITSMNSLHESIVRDLGKVTEIIMRRAIVVAASHVISEGSGLDNATLRLEELVLNGTLNQTPESLMENSTLSDWIKKMESVSIIKGFYSNLTLLDLEIKPYDSWNLLVRINLSINITDKQGVASLTRNETIDTLVFLEGLEDPLSPLNTEGRVTNTIRKSPFDGNFTQLLLIGNGGNGWAYANVTNNIANKNGKILVVHNASEVDLSGVKGVISETDILIPITVPYVVNSSALSLIPSNINLLLDGDNGKVWFIDNFKKHVENSYYYSSNNGPSFLDRLEGNLTCNYCSLTPNIIGLESFVNKKELISLGLPIVENKTNIDYLYFSESFVSGEKVKGITDDFNYFRIDSSHQPIYGVEFIIES